MGEVAEVTQRIFDALDDVSESPDRRARDGLAGPRRRGQDARAGRARCAGPGWSSAAPSRCCAPRCAPGVTTAELDAIAEDAIRTAGRDAVVPRLPGLPGLDLHLGERRGGARHPRRPRAASRATWSRSTAARSSTAGTATPRSRCRWARSRPELVALVADTEAAMWAGIAAARPGRPGGRHLRTRSRRRLRAATAATASSRTTPATASARRCTSRPTYRTSAGPAAAPGWSRAWRWRSSRWSRSAATRPTLLDDDWTVVTADGSWAAHAEHTFALTDRGAWVLTAADGGEEALTALGVPVRRADRLVVSAGCPREGSIPSPRGRQHERQVSAPARGPPRPITGRWKRPSAVPRPLAPRRVHSWMSPPGSWWTYHRGHGRLPARRRVHHRPPPARAVHQGGLAATWRSTSAPAILFGIGVWVLRRGAVRRGVLRRAG